MVNSDIYAGDDSRDAAQADNGLGCIEPVYRSLFWRKNTRRLSERSRRRVLKATLLQSRSIPF